MFFWYGAGLTNFFFTVDKTYMNLKSRIRYNKQIYIKLQFISRRLDGKSLKKKLLFCIYSINGGGSRGGPPPLFLDQRPEGPKKGFWRPGTPLISGSGSGTD